MNITTAQTTELIRSRRSIYPAIYTGEVIDDKVIMEMLENANWAPTHKLTQPWRFKVFSGEGILKLAEFQSDLYREVTQENGTYQEEKFEKLRSKPRMCSHIISIGMKRHPIVPEMEEIAAVSCAVQNMYLTAAAHGVGCYWGTGGVTYYDQAKAFFDLGKEDRFMGFLFCGIPKKWPTGRRAAIEEKVDWVRE